jgi:hypothetical protein
MLTAKFGMFGLAGGTTGSAGNSKILLGSISINTDPVAPVMVTPPSVIKTTKSLLLTSTGPKSKGPIALVAPLFEVAIRHI